MDTGKIAYQEVADLLESWRQKHKSYSENANAFKSTGYYGRMAEAERDVAKLIIKDLESLLSKATEH